MKGYVRIDEFIDTYNVSEENVYSFISKDRSLVKKHNKALYINKRALERRKEFQKRIWLNSHDNYYRIIEESNENRLSIILSKYSKFSKVSWQHFLSTSLFSPSLNDTSIFVNKVSERAWAFYRITTFIIRRIERHEKRIIDRVLSRMPNRDKYKDMPSYKSREEFCNAV